MAQPFKTGIIGCGNISNTYFTAAKKFDSFQVVAAADIDLARAKAKAGEHGIAKAYTVEELLADSEIDLVVNLTIPAAHYDVSLAALEAGKHVYGEKPLSSLREEGRHLLEVANARGLRIGSAPDTFLGAGIQTCRDLIDSGEIGEPIGASAFMVGHGPEKWHPNPEIFYKPGAGPLFDMGPYYLTALVNLLGPIESISGSARASFPERTIGSGPHAGQTFKVETPTHVTGAASFRGGVIASVIFSFDVWHTQLPRIEIYGAEGTLIVPDPNTFGGPVKLRKAGDKEWTTIELTRDFADNSRGIGAADMAYAFQENRPHRASGELAYHVLESMHGFLQSSQTRSAYALQSTVERPEPLPLGWPAIR